MAFRSFQTRIIVSFLALITLVQVGAFIAVNSAITRSARAYVKAQLATAAKVFTQVIDARNRRLIEAARILSEDFAFKQVVALNDRATLLSAMDNHRGRIGSDLMMVASLENALVADTSHREAHAVDYAVLIGFPKLVAAAQESGEVATFAVIDDHLYQLVVVPLRAPDPIAWIGMGFRIDDRLAEELHQTTSSHVSFVRAGSANVWTAFTSTLPPTAQRSLVGALSRQESHGDASIDDRGVFGPRGTEFETLVLQLPSLTPTDIRVTLHRSLADAMEPYRALRVTLLALFGLAACVSVIGGVWVARGVSRPVQELVAAARGIEAGHYGAVVEMRQRDEIGELAATFNRMTSAVAEREERLRESEERFRTMTESAVDAVVTADANGNIVSWNRGARAAFGYAPEEVLGTPLTRLVPEHLRDVDAEGRERIAPTDVTPALERPVELHGVRKDRRAFPIELSLARWETRRGSFLTVIIRDITERRQLEEQFRQAQKMESIGRLAGGLAHDFNNLLTVIGGHAELLRGRLQPEDPLHRRIGHIQEAAAHAADLTKQLLAFSRKQVLAPQILDLNAVVVEIEPMLRRLIGEDIDLVTAPARGLSSIKADPAQIKQILLNLAVNARDAMPQGGKLTIETENVEVDQHYARLHPDVTPGTYVMLAVTDTGIGMDEETRSRIFEPFFTTKAAGLGTGLGLATVYGIVKQSNGAISVYSEPGLGTAFKVYLPRVLETVDSVATTAPAGCRGGSETILLVEDNEMVRTLTCEILKRQGYTVVEARHGADALDLARRYHGPIHLLLTDVVMPEMSGPELVARLAPMRPQMKIIYMSGYTADAIDHQGMLDEGIEFLPKPIGLDTLVRKLRDVLDGRGRALLVEAAR
jgi:PAS domain S-box-containing protein